MLLWLACFGAAAIIIEMVSGIFFWMLLAIRFWWLILICVGLYYAYTGVMTVLGTYPSIGYYWHYVWPALIGSGLRMIWLRYHPSQQSQPPLTIQQPIE